MQILVIIIQNSVSHKEVGVATATNNFFREIGASVGGAFVGGLFSHKLVELLTENLPKGAASSEVNSLTPTIVDSLPNEIRTIIVQAYNDAFTPIFAYLIPLFAVGLIILLFIKQVSIKDIEKIEHLEDYTEDNLVAEDALDKTKHDNIDKVKQIEKIEPPKNSILNTNLPKAT
jgi:hypothetical protein